MNGSYANDREIQFDPNAGLCEKIRNTFAISEGVEVDLAAGVARECVGMPIDGNARESKLKARFKDGSINCSHDRSFGVKFVRNETNSL
jgi:hypothetical protein